MLAAAHIVLARLDLSYCMLAIKEVREPYEEAVGYPTVNMSMSM